MYGIVAVVTAPELPTFEMTTGFVQTFHNNDNDEDDDDEWW